MPKYSSQSNFGKVELMAGETEGLIFTESDRRAARHTLDSFNETKEFDTAVLDRLKALASQGNSYQAQWYLDQVSSKLNQ